MKNLMKTLPVCTKEGKIDMKLIILFTAFIGALVALDTVTLKIICIGPFVLSIGSMFFPITFLITDVTTEVWGKKISYILVIMGVFAEVLAIIIYAISVVVHPAVFWTHQTEFAFVFTAAPRIMLASIITFFSTEMYDVWIFAKIKEWTKGKHLWIRNNASTIGSEILNSIIFVTLAFSGTMSAQNMYNMIFATAVVKILLALADTPFCYLLVRWARGQSAQEFFG